MRATASRACGRRSKGSRSSWSRTASRSRETWGGTGSRWKSWPRPHGRTNSTPWKTSAGPSSRQTGGSASFRRRPRRRELPKLRLARVTSVGDRVVADRLDHLGPVEQPCTLVDGEAILDVAILQDLGEVATAVMLTD